MTTEPRPPRRRQAEAQSLIVSHVATSPAEVGNPTVDTDYALCIYDETANVPALAARIDVPAGSGWQAINPTRFQYKDVAGSVNGVQRLRIDGKAKGTKVQLQAKGPSIPLPGPVASDRYFVRDDHVIVQLRNTAEGAGPSGSRVTRGTPRRSSKRRRSSPSDGRCGDRLAFV